MYVRVLKYFRYNTRKRPIVFLKVIYHLNASFPDNGIKTSTAILSHKPGIRQESAKSWIIYKSGNKIIPDIRKKVLQKDLSLIFFRITRSIIKKGMALKINPKINNGRPAIRINIFIIIRRSTFFLSSRSQLLSFNFFISWR